MPARSAREARHARSMPGDGIGMGRPELAQFERSKRDTVQKRGPERDEFACSLHAIIIPCVAFYGSRVPSQKSVAIPATSLAGR